MNGFFTAKEIAANLKMNEEYIRRLLRKGEIIGIKIGSDWRVADGDLQAFINIRKGDNRKIECSK